MFTPSRGAAIQTGNRPSGYYDQARPDLASLVPPSCVRVLDIGCGTGQLGRLLGERGHHVTGVELSPEACAVAALHLEKVLCADLEAGPLPLAPASFDALVLADILEHLVDPWRIFADLALLLQPHGLVVLSVPNVQNLDVVWRLLRGRWDYRERGIQDIGHLRFFTLDGIRKLLEGAGFSIARVGHRYRRTLLRKLACGLTFGAAQAFLTRQYLVVARRAPVSRRGSGPLV